VKQLFLFRHAKSSWKEPALSDFDRPLNKRGRSAAKLMADYIARKNQAATDPLLRFEADVRKAGLYEPATTLGWSWQRLWLNPGPARRWQKLLKSLDKTVTPNSQKSRSYSVRPPGNNGCMRT
jgi:hypothetical protein